METVRKEWEKLKPELQVFKEKMSALAEGISEEQVKNFEKWRTLDWHVSVGLICLGSWEKEVEYVQNFFADRVEWLDRFLRTTE